MYSLTLLWIQGSGNSAAFDLSRY